VALLTDCRYTDLQSKLQHTQRFAAVDLVDVVTTTPQLSTLLAYDAVITWGDTNDFDSVAWFRDANPTPTSNFPRGAALLVQ
jgi:hypothetical protein